MSEQGDKQRHGWLPEQDDLEDWLAAFCSRPGVMDPDRPLRPSVQALKDLIDSDPILRMYATRMIEQVPESKPYTKRHLTDVDQLMRLIDEVTRTAPEFSSDSVVMVPLNAILDWTMATSAGFAFYRDPRVNKALKDVLTDWCEYLNSPDSLSVLNRGPNGWMSDRAAKTIGIEQFRHDPSDLHWGFTSWNDFFTRHFHERERPVASPDDDRIIVSACESTPYNLATDVARYDEFWVKKQPYSLEELLAGDPVVDELVGGTVYQAFLSATEYHRWHSPVSGTVERAFVRPGTYFSEADSEEEEAADATRSQGYMAHVATRAIIVIKADNPAIGSMAVVPVGMGDVSSCMIGVEPGQHVTKGDELGYFQFGGSTECLVFRPGAIESFALQAVPESDPGVVKVRSHLATATA